MWSLLLRSRFLYIYIFFFFLRSLLRVDVYQNAFIHCGETSLGCTTSQSSFCKESKNPRLTYLRHMKAVAVRTKFRWIFKTRYKKLVTQLEQNNLKQE